MRQAHAAAGRLCLLLAQLDQSARPGDLHQVLPGVRTEAGIIRSHLREAVAALDALQEAVTADSPGKVRSDARATSRAAAMVVRTGTARARVLVHLLTSGPETDLQLQNHLVLPANTERPRRGELVDLGLVMPSGRTVVHHGQEWTVWSLTRTGEGVARRLNEGARSVDVPTTMPTPEVSTVNDQEAEPALF